MNDFMEVTVSIKVKFNPADWTLCFGTEGRRAIRQEVKDYIANEALGMGVFSNGEVPCKVSAR